MNRNLKRKSMLKKIRKIVADSAQRINPEKVILFGSYAYGKPDRNSDIDLLFIQNTSLSGISRSIWVSKNIEHTFPIDIIVKTPAEIKKRLDMGDPFYREIIKTGKIMYESSK